MLRTPTRSRRRRGAILLVVITLLALFAVIGLSFALYADAQANAARMEREAQNNPRDASDIEAILNPGDYFNQALGQLIFGGSDSDGQSADPNVQRRLQSGFRGYEFARLMYGQPRRPGTLNPMPVLTPYTGTGLFTAADGLPPMNLPGIGAFDRTQVINYGYMPGSGFIIDPEYSSYRNTIALPTAFDGSQQVYKNVAAPYTYPDLKDLYLAVIDPTTGTVLQPSFFRSYAFNASAPAGMNLAPPDVVATNTDWLTPAGRLRLIRPRPADQMFDPDGLGPAPANTEFPYPPPNADGTYTGDVVNFPGVQNNQKYDSMWVYPGGPVKVYKGKRYTALIAPMVIDLNGRVNLATAGNRKAGGTNHASSQGQNLSEVNPRWVFDPAATTQGSLTPASQTALQQLLSGGTFQTTSGTATVSGRYNPATPTVPPADRLTLQSQIPLNNGRVPPHYAGIDADAVGNGAADRAVPAGSGTSPSPVFPNTRYLDLTTQAAELGNHPAQYNPDYYNRTANNYGPFLPIDQRVLGTKYAGQAEPYTRADAPRLAPQQLISQYLAGPPYDPYNAPTATQDQANLTRALVTTFSTSLNRAEVLVRTGPENPPGSGNYPMARLGAVDVNRNLPDYRDLSNPVNQPTPKMLGPDNMGNWGLAQAARQRLARDIFVRLAALSDVPGSPGTKLIDGTNVAYVATPPTNPADYTDPNNDYGYLRINPAVFTAPATVGNALRDLAQVAVNMVDFLDPDDVSTTFVWNPRNPTAGANQLGYVLNNANGMPSIAGGMTPAPVAATPTTPGQMLPTDLGNHVVYGAEAPRVLLNEVYAELANDPIDYDPSKGTMSPPGMPPKATQPFQRRFWVELFNPMRADPALSENGLARLYYPAGVFGLAAPYAPYTVAVTNYVANGVTDPTNVTGSPRHTSAATAGVTLQLLLDQYTYDKTTADYPPDPSVVGPNEDPAGTGVINEAATYTPYPPVTPSVPNTNIQLYVVQPHSGSGAGLNATNQNGFYVLGPEQNFPGQDATNSGNPAATIRIKPQASVLYPSVESALRVKDTGPNDGTAYATQTKPVTVLLRRLANPYLPPNDPVEPPPTGYNPALPPNPYIAVDRQEQVPVNNNVQFTGGPTGGPTPPNLANETSLGRPHPYAATLAAAQSTAVGTSPKSTFFNHNDNTGLSPTAPFHWFVHLDRQVYNPVELAGVSAVRPTRVTDSYAQAGTPPTYGRHTIESLILPGLAGGIPVSGTMDMPPGPGAGYLRQALDLLTTRPAQSAVPVGGRQQGKININTAWHPAVFRALLDRNDANFFRDADVSGTAAFSSWERMTTPGSGLRSQASPLFNVGPTDTPFWGMGDVAFRGTTPGTNSAYPPPTRPLFRVQDPSDTTLTPPLTLPASAQTQPAVLAEPLKKMWNNTTTTSDAFLVIMTVGFFEVRNNPAPGDRVILGKELYDQVPGDRRFKFFSVVDRTQLALASTTPSGNPPLYQQAQSVPFQTVLIDDMVPTATPTNIRVAADAAGKVYVNGDPVQLAAGQTLWFGFGDGTPASPTYNVGDGEQLTITTVTPGPPNSGYVTLTVPAVNRYHPSGSPVTNYLIGNPGPQATFDPNDPRFKSVVPYFARDYNSQ
jgi:hypothetical protein